MPYIEPIGMDADDVTAEFEVKNASVVFAESLPDDDAHEEFIQAGNVFALNQLFAKTFIGDKVTTVPVAVPSTLNTALFLLGEDGFDLDDFKFKELPEKNRYLVLLDINDVEPESHINRNPKEGIFFLGDDAYREMLKATDKAGPTTLSPNASTKN